MQRFRLFCLCLSLVPMLSVQAQDKSQPGVVRTALRPGRSIVYLDSVTIRQQGKHTAVLSGNGGKFELLLPGTQVGDAFRLRSVRKLGYELKDNELIGRDLAYSPKVPVEIVMLNTREKEADMQRIADNAYRRAEQTYARRLSDLEKQLAEKTLDEAAYRDQLQQLQTWFDRYEALIEDLSERYASTDYATIDSLGAAVNQAIEQGELERADSLIATVGPLDRLVQQSLEAKDNARRRQQLGQDITAKATADLASIRANDQRLGHLLYGKYSTSLARAEANQAAHSLLLRADLDTTNVQWQLEAGVFMANYLGDYDKALSLYQRALRNAVSQYGGQHKYVADSYGNIGAICAVREAYADALSYGQKALDIRLAIFGEDHPDVATSYNNMGAVYKAQAAYAEALSCYQKALEIYRRAYGETHANVAMCYNI